MGDKRYNGWTNYETWNVALWMDNEEGSYKSVRRLTADMLEHHGNDREAAKHAIAEQLKGEYEEAMQSMLDEARASSSMWADLLGAALSEVDWREIAANLIDEVYEPTEAESV